VALAEALRGAGGGAADGAGGCGGGGEELRCRFLGGKSLV
jgi:hypothetical protein